MKDYFAEAVSLFPAYADETFTTNDIFREDIEKYKEYIIRQYNGNIEKATDEFCFKKFLNEYQVAVNVFNLHSNMTTKRALNQCIEMCWQIVVYEKDKEWL